jgi:hypothetical protein
MLRLNHAVCGQRRGLATLDDRAHHVGRQEGKIDEISDAALATPSRLAIACMVAPALISSNQVRPRAMVLTSVWSKAAGGLASTSLASTPRRRSVNAPTSDSASRLICASGTPRRSAMASGHKVTDGCPGSMRPPATIAFRVGPDAGRSALRRAIWRRMEAWSASRVQRHRSGPGLPMASRARRRSVGQRRLPVLQPASAIRSHRACRSRRSAAARRSTGDACRVAPRGMVSGDRRFRRRTCQPRAKGLSQTFLPSPGSRWP